MAGIESTVETVSIQNMSTQTIKSAIRKHKRKRRTLEGSRKKDRRLFLL